MQYAPLDATQNQIRLLHLAPASNYQQCIECHFSIVSSAEQYAHYEALSYTWGVPVLDNVIQLEGTPFAVTLNLHQALAALRYEDRERIIWVDAICVDQKNNEERSHQVSRMSDIYTRASRVIVWLGEPWPDAELAFKFYEWFGHQHLDCSPLFELDHNAERTMLSLEIFMAKPWWTRIWTAQEWILAANTTFQVGQYKLEGKVLVRCLKHSNRHAKSFHCCDMQLDLNVVLKLKDLLQPLSALISVKRLYRWVDFSWSVGFLRTRQASDLRDKVYGVLALASDHYVDLVEVDYTLPLEIVYECFTVALIERTKNLDILSHIAPNKARNLELPSFVCDWTVNLGWEYGSAWIERLENQFEYKACLDKAVDFRRKPGAIQVRGAVIDTVKVMSRMRLDSHHKTTSYCNDLLNEMLDMAEPTYNETYPHKQQTRKEAFWLTLCGDRAFPAEKERNEDPKSLCIYSSHYRLNRRVKDFGGFESWETWFRGSRTSCQTLDWRLRELAENISSVSKGRTFCTTAKRRMGWVPKNSLPGDVIAVLTGGRVPIILRPHNDYFEVVGDAYIHGIMDGEAMEGIDDLEYVELR